MNVTFKNGEKVLGYTCVNRNGLSRFTFENEDIRITFDSDAGEGRNYSKVISYYNKHTGRGYQAMRYLYKYVSLVQKFSNVLYQKYKEENVK